MAAMSATRNAQTMNPLTHARVIHCSREGFLSTVQAAAAAKQTRR